MIALNIVDVKDFMSKVLVKNTFDKFYLCDGEIETFTTFTFGGKLNTGYCWPRSRRRFWAGGSLVA